MIFTLRPATRADEPSIERLTADAFGPGRFAKAAYRVRERAEAFEPLCFVSEMKAELVGSVTTTPVGVGTKSGLLLGPLVVAPAHKRIGIGRALVAAACDGADAYGFGFLLLVGDEPYYGPLGFRRTVPGAVQMPGPTDPARILVRWTGRPAELHGRVDGASAPLAVPQRRESSREQSETQKA